MEAKMNRKGQMYLSIVIALLLFMGGILFVNFLIPDIDTARSSANLDCNNSTITDGNKLACLAVDSVMPYFIIVLISTAGGIITARLVSRLS